MTLPLKPIKGPEELPAVFDARVLNWWRECDIQLREAQAVRCEEFSQLGTQLEPTLNRIADAWDAFDVRLGELAAALRGAPPLPAPVPLPAPAPVPPTELVATTLQVLTQWRALLNTPKSVPQDPITSP